MNTFRQAQSQKLASCDFRNLSLGDWFTRSATPGCLYLKVADMAALQVDYGTHQTLQRRVVLSSNTTVYPVDTVIEWHQRLDNEQ